MENKDTVIGIIVDRTKLLSENIKSKGYTGDIVEAKFPVNALPKIDDILVMKDPYKYHYNYIYKSENNFPLYEPLEKAKILHVSKCPYQREKGIIGKGYELIMISEVAKSWNIHDNLPFSEKFPFSNPKAILINKRHKVWGNALFFLIDVSKKQYVGISGDTFKEIYKKSIIVGKKSITFISEIKKKIVAKNNLIGQYKEQIYGDVMRRYHDEITKIIKKGPNNKEIDNLSWSIVWSSNSQLDEKKFASIFKYNPQSDILKYKKELLDKIIKEEDKKHEAELKKMGKELVDLAKSKFTREERRKHALDFLKYITDENFLTLEDAYIICSAQINNQYVIGGKPWFESGAFFHPLDEFENLMITLDDGVSYEGLSNDPNELKYYTEKSSNIIK